MIPSSHVIRLAGERGHACKPHAVFDDPEQFAVAQVLRGGTPQIGRLGIEAVAYWRVAAPVVSVTNRAVIRKMQSRVALSFCGVQHRVLGSPRLPRNRQVTRIASHKRFQPRRCRLGAQPIMQHRSSHRQGKAEEHEADQDHKCAAFHGNKNIFAEASPEKSRRLWYPAQPKATGSNTYK